MTPEKLLTSYTTAENDARTWKKDFPEFERLANNDAFPRPWASRNHHGRLVVGPSRTTDGVSHALEGLPLLVEQHEHLASLDLVGGKGHELFRGSHSAREERVSGGSPTCGGEVGPEEGTKLAATLSCEEPYPRAATNQQVRDTEIGRIV